jgi:hypothetical protein
VGGAIDVAGAEDKAAAELEGILSELVLTVAGSVCGCENYRCEECEAG